LPQPQREYLLAREVRILFVADLHYTLKQFDWLAANAAGFDAVIIGGDLLDLGSIVDIDVQILVVEKYLARLREITRLLVSSGNHDCNVRSEAGESVCKWLQDARAGQLFVDGDRVELAGMLITICPWWDGPVSRADVEKLLVRDAERTEARWIWIHHAPADQSPVSWTGKEFGGDKFLVEWIRRFEPDLVLSGHIHNAPFVPHGSWIDRIGRTWVFNPGKQIGPHPTCLIIDLEQMQVDWDSTEIQGKQELNIPTGAFTGPTVVDDDGPGC
jgi:Icc-related predicted phosphoesterase